MRDELRKDVVELASALPSIENGEASDVVVESIDEKIYVVIAESDLSKLNKKKAGSATMLAKSIGGSALVVAERAGSEHLIDEVVYEKYGLPVVNLETFTKMLKGEKIYIRKKKSVFTITINSEKLRKLREESGISLGALAEYLGVSRKSVYEYERGRKNVSVDIAVKLAELFGDEILEPVRFEEYKGIEIKVGPHNELEAEVLERTDSVHVPKGKVSVGGRVEGKEFSVLVPHGKEGELSWFAELSKIVKRITVAMGFEDIPKELEDSKVEIARDVDQLLKIIRRDEMC